MALENRTTPSGRGYLEDFKSVDKATIIYLHGSGQRGTGSPTDLNKIKQVAFFTSFYSNYAADYNFLMPQQFSTFAGWENMINGKTAGADFVLWAKQYYGITKVIPTGHSAGGTWETAAWLQREIGGFAPVAGRGLSYSKVVEFGRNRVPVMAWHGDKDTAKPNDYSGGKQAISWYKTGGGVPIWNVLPGVAHDSDKYAYLPNSGLKEWIDSIYPPVEAVPFVPGIYIDGVFAGASEATYVDPTGKSVLIEYKTEA